MIRRLPFLVHDFFRAPLPGRARHAAPDRTAAGVPERPLERSDGWRDRLGAAGIATVEKTAGDLLAELGYGG